ncbi:MAG TPA: DUF2637 domain-containing protein [Mycobacterium sp.]|uniref:DUF2637 domain-containing protein n=1 Tax=Mycobacterium sp. TaxID=1785 RepID=UPI002C0142A1|nr:DUF2637 domain-containing protein [Mycobacterium sp.]HME77641.1 DUF2637 domain-containing protein [Mycobacterium sp.]
MTTQAEISQGNHRRAVRFFWGLLIGATTVSLLGNITHAVLRYVPQVVIQVGAAAVPPMALLAAVHGIALAVRAGASGRVYCCAVSAVAAIGVGAFAVSFLALRDLMQAVGYNSEIACIFPAIIDTAVAVSTLMLVALGDQPVRRARTGTTSSNTQPPALQRLTQTLTRRANGDVAPAMTSARARPVQAKRVPRSASVQPGPAPTVQPSVRTDPKQVNAEIARVDSDLASELIASRVTTQPVETVVAVLAAHRNGASINAAAKASGINFRTAQRIVQAAGERRQRQLVAVG